MGYGAYSGSCCYDVVIDRYKDPDTGKYYTEGEAEEIDLDEKFEFKEILLFVEGGAYYIPGCLFRAPEDCYPEESDVEITSVKDEDGNDWESRLTESEIKMLEDLIIENVKNPY